MSYPQPGDRVFLTRAVEYAPGRTLLAGIAAVVVEELPFGEVLIRADDGTAEGLPLAVPARILRRYWRRPVREAWCRLFGHREDADLSVLFGRRVCTRCDPIHSRAWHTGGSPRHSHRPQQPLNGPGKDHP